MKKFTVKLLRKEHGSSVVLVGLSMLTLLTMTGFVVDIGTLYVEKTHMQKAANAAVLSGAQELTNSETEVTNVVDHILTDHSELESLDRQQIEMEKTVKVDLRRNVPLPFSHLFGMDSADVNVHAAAEILPMGKGIGAAPLGIDDSIQLEYYKTYKLKVDQTQVDTGNFGVLALGGTGSKTYEDNLLNGYSNELKVGDIIDTQTGNIAGKTRTVIQQRIDDCPYLPGETYHRDCSRILLIPTYTPWNNESNQLKSVKITGFAYFYITEPMSSTDTSITGMFIIRAGQGTADPTVVNKGAYSIRLTE